MAQTSTTYQNAIETLQNIPSEYPARIGKEMNSSEMNRIGKKIEGILHECLLFSLYIPPSRAMIKKVFIYR